MEAFLRRYSTELDEFILEDEGSWFCRRLRVIIEGGKSSAVGESWEWWESGMKIDSSSTSSEGALGELGG